MAIQQAWQPFCGAHYVRGVLPDGEVLVHVCLREVHGTSGQDGFHETDHGTSWCGPQEIDLRVSR